jgi:hypothetical protein
MGTRKHRSVGTALKLLTEQVYTVWALGGGKNVATLLLLNILGAFNTVNTTRLLDTLRRKKLPG